MRNPSTRCDRGSGGAPSASAPRAGRSAPAGGFSRFNVSASVLSVADDATGRENLARYLFRAPFSMNQIRYDPAAQSVICMTKRVEGPNCTFV